MGVHNGTSFLMSLFVCFDVSSIEIVHSFTGFGGITDIKTVPDGYLYVLSILRWNFIQNKSSLCPTIIPYDETTQNREEQIVKLGI